MLKWIKLVCLKAIFPLFLFSCHRSDSWSHQKIPNGNTCYDLAKLTYPPSNKSSGIELELTRYGKEIHGYINIHEHQLFPYKNDPHKTALTIETIEGTRTFIISLLEGRQRARLTSSALEYLLQNLILKSSITLSSGYFTQVLDSKNFKRHYDAFLRKPYSPLITFEFY